MPIVRPEALENDLITPDHFGANILATLDRLGPDGTYDDVVESLGVTHVRYPGGSLAEEFFDISDPTKDVVESVISAQAISFLPYDEFMTWAEAENLEVTIVIPTITQLGDLAGADSNGDRFPDIEEDVLRGFIRDTLDGKYGAPEIKAFEIGNEYFGSGEMSSVEYGRLASEMALILKDEINSHPQAAQFADIDILVQMGVNHGDARLDNFYSDLATGQEQLDALEADYRMDFPADKFLFSNGTVSWARVNSALVANEFDTPEEVQSVDAIVAHVYGRGLDVPSSWYFDFRVIDDAMGETFPEVTKYVTEWNSRSEEFTTDENERFGLEQAHEMMHLLNTMTGYDVESANIWPVQQSTATDLSGPEGQSELTVAGEMFRMMAENLPGTYAIRLDGSVPGEDEVSTLHSDYWLFAGPERSSVFVFAHHDETEDISLDLSEVFSDMGTVAVQRLGVQPGDQPESRDAQPDLVELNPTDILNGFTADVTLDPHEVLHISFENPTYVQAFGDMIPEYTPPATDPTDENPDIILGGENSYLPGGQDGIISGGEDAYVDPNYEEPDTPEVDPFDFDGGDGGGGGIGAVLGALLLLPILAALG